MIFSKLLSFFIGPRFPLGALQNPHDNRDIRLATFQQPVSLPGKYMSDLSALAIEDQKLLGTCVGQAKMKAIQYFVYKQIGLVADLSARFPYALAKRVDGYPGQGTYPRIADKIIISVGIPETVFVPNDNSLSHEQYLNINDSNAAYANALRYKPSGFAAVEENLFAIKNAIFQNGVVTGTVPVGNWNILPVLSTPFRGNHHTLWYGFEDLEDGDTKIYFQNSWSINWLQNLAGWLFGRGYFLWSEYQGKVFDISAFAPIPQELLQKAKAIPFRFSHDLRFGSSHLDVIQLQKLLNAFSDTQVAKWGAGSPGQETAYFGSLTKEALIRYQSKHAISPASGFFGPLTRAEANKAILPKMGLIEALILVESGGDDNAVGDRNLANKAYGCLQIRQPYLDDVIAEFPQLKGEKAEALLGNRNLSTSVFEAYMEIYATPARLGRPVTDQDRARIHNGGPDGWKKQSTAAYWNKVSKVLL